METFKPLVCLNIKSVGIGLFQFVDKDELFSKEEYELEISKMRKMLIKELEDDIITERAKTINNAVKEIETLITSEKSERTKKIREQLASISNVLFSEPKDCVKPQRFEIPVSSLEDSRKKAEIARVQDRRKARQEADEVNLFEQKATNPK